MTTRADRLVQRAKASDGTAMSATSDPAWMVRVFMEATDRLGYDVDPLFAQAEDPIRVIVESRDGRNSTFGFEFGVTLLVRHIREEAGDRFCASYVSFQ